MERFLYTAMSGAQHSLLGQRIHANNLANVNSTGFRADFERSAAYRVGGEGFRTRFMAQQQNAGTRHSAGAMVETGRALDIAIRGSGLIAVEGSDGAEAYTRAGNLEVQSDGRLTLNGRDVLGENGGIVLPEFRDIDIASDGTVTVTPPDGGAQLEVGRIKLVDPDIRALGKGLDGLLRVRGGSADADDGVQLAANHLEGSNVNAVDEMIDSMALSRSFELQVKLMRAADEQAHSGAKLISGQS